MDVKKLRKKILSSDTFCFFPFTQISSNPSGHLKPCCNYVGTVRKQEGSFYNINQGDTFDSFWNSDEMVNLRKSLTEGIVPDKCRRCVRDDLASMRAESVRVYKNNIDALNNVLETIENGYVSQRGPTYLELKPSNLCNLKCVMCNSYDSSQIAKELKQLSEKFTGVKVQDGRFIELSNEPGINENNDVWNTEATPDWSDHEEIWANFECIAPHLEIMSFAGGEPTIMPSVLKTLNYLVDNNYAKNIKIFLSSNFTNLNKNFLELMPHFKQFELIASIDGFDKVNDYCRFPSNWSQVSKNYKIAKSYMKNDNVKILVNITVHSLNILNLTDLLYFIEDQSNEYPFFKEWPYNINLLMYPLEQQIFVLPPHIKQIAKERLEKYKKDSVILKEFAGLDEKINLLLREIDKPYDDNLFQTFKRRTNFLDNHRKINVGNFIPELANAFK